MVRVPVRALRCVTTCRSCRRTQLRVAALAIVVPLLLCSLLWAIAASGYYNDTYLRTTVTYCPFDGTIVHRCVQSGVQPWGWFSNCWKNTTAEPYTSMDQLFSCRLCSETSTCVNSEPQDAYLKEKELTFVATAAYVTCMLNAVRTAHLPQGAQALMGSRHTEQIMIAVIAHFHIPTLRRGASCRRHKGCAR